MGRRTLIEYSQTPDVTFFLCRRCRTHIALTQELVCRDWPHDHQIYVVAVMLKVQSLDTLEEGNQLAPEVNLGFFRNLVNVQVDGSAHYRRDGDYTGADVYCYTCDSHLGWKFFEVPDDIILLGLARFVVLLNKLLMWEDDRMLDAETNEPVGNA